MPTASDRFISFKSDQGTLDPLMTWRADGSIGTGTDNPDARFTISNVGDVNGTKMLGFGEVEESDFWFESGFAPFGGENFMSLANVMLGPFMTWKADGLLLQTQAH